MSIKQSVPVFMFSLLFPQRLCEELEYSELLDKAVQFDDPYERMVSTGYLLNIQNFT